MFQNKPGVNAGSRKQGQEKQHQRDHEQGGEEGAAGTGAQVALFLGHRISRGRSPHAKEGIPHQEKCTGVRIQS